MQERHTPNEGLSMRNRTLLIVVGILAISLMAVAAPLLKNTTHQLIADNEDNLEHDEVIFGSNNGAV